MSRALTATGRPSDRPAILGAAQEAVAACLALQPESKPELVQLIAEVGWDRLLAAADDLRLGNVLAGSLQQNDVLPPIPAVELPDGRLTVPAAVAQRLARHRAIRSAQEARLFDLVQALNAHGIIPLPLKGARSLWLEQPEWRSMRDVDLLVPSAAVGPAQEIAKDLGYGEMDAAPPGHHHLPNLYRDDLPGWIEFHDRAGVPRVESLLGTRELWALATVSERPAGRAMVIPPSLHVLHSMLHHHIGHGGDKDVGVSLKGLYEFAREVAALDEGERLQLMRRAALHPRTLAIAELWVAAGADLFGMPVLPPLVLAADARQWWVQRRSRWRKPASGLSFERLAEVRAATTKARLARIRHPLLRHAAPAALATLWSFVQRPRR